MKFIITYTGEEFTPMDPNIEQIHIEDIAHSLSLLCRANGHIDYFFSVAQHSINCTTEAKARGFSMRVQLACLLHDASESYISDLTRPVKYYLTEYNEVETRLQAVIYNKFLGEPLTIEESNIINEIDNDMLAGEFFALMKKRQLLEKRPVLYSTPSFEYRDQKEIETEFLKTYYGIMHAGIIQGR